jgi:hypothetical protein
MGTEKTQGIVGKAAIAGFRGMSITAGLTGCRNRVLWVLVASGGTV